MQYFGGKQKISKYIVPFLKSVRKEHQKFIEPFVGGYNISSKMDGEIECYDYNEYLIELYKALQNGFDMPDVLTEDEYNYIKNNKDENKALTAFVGFGCSFAGKWFGGYARNKIGHNYCLSAKNSMLKKIRNQSFTTTKFGWRDYKTLNPNGCLIYCDPPYKNTTKYNGTPSFDSEEFWNIMRIWSKNNDVYISEYQAPEDFECVLKITTKTSIRDKSGEVINRVEKLFKMK